MFHNLTNLSRFSFDNHSIPVNETCDTHYIAGITITLIFLIGMALNMTLIILVYRSREVRETRNLYFIGLLLVNLINGPFDLPLFILRNFSCK